MKILKVIRFCFVFFFQMLLPATLIFFITINSCFASSKNLIKLNEESWQDLLKGEWMVELLVIAFFVNNLISDNLCFFITEIGVYMLIENSFSLNFYTNC